MIGNAPHVSDEWLAKAMRNSDRGDVIQAIARMLFSRKGQDDSTDEPVKHFVFDASDYRRDASANDKSIGL